MESLHPTKARLPDHIEDRLKILRAEADEVKGCFTQFSFQALALGSGVLGLMFSTFSKHPYIGMAGVPIAYLLALVIRIGNYKYGTANRNYGYELHLHRALLYRGHFEPPKSTQQIIEFGWEEAMFAWRIVQPTLRKAIYEKAFFGLYEKDKKAEAVYRWWDTRSLIKPKDGERPPEALPEHEPGGYLKTMQRFLGCIAVLCILPAYGTFWYYQFRNPVGPSIQIGSTTIYIYSSICVIIATGALIHILFKIIRDRSHRIILEKWR